jgi:molecular chaperone DnaK
MIKEAETFATEEKRRREEAEALNSADVICYQGERFLADFDDKVAAAQRTPIDQQIKDLKAAIAAKNSSEATSIAEALKKLLQEAGTALYGQARTGAAAAGAAAEPSDRQATGPSAHGRVVDAECREKRP